MVGQTPYLLGGGWEARSRSVPRPQEQDTKSGLDQGTKSLSAQLWLAVQTERTVRRVLLARVFPLPSQNAFSVTRSYGSGMSAPPRAQSSKLCSTVRGKPYRTVVWIH